MTRRRGDPAGHPGTVPARVRRRRRSQSGIAAGGEPCPAQPHRVRSHGGERGTPAPAHVPLRVCGQRVHRCPGRDGHGPDTRLVGGVPRGAVPAVPRSRRAGTPCQVPAGGPFLYIPGLLQTEEYARAVYAYRVPELPEHELELRVRHRMQRKVFLQGVGGIPYEVIIHEAAPRIMVADRAAARVQLARLVELAETDQVIVRVIPSARRGRRRAHAAVAVPGRSAGDRTAGAAEGRSGRPARSRDAAAGRGPLRGR